MNRGDSCERTIRYNARIMWRIAFVLLLSAPVAVMAQVVPAGNSIDPNGEYVPVDVGKGGAPTAKSEGGCKPTPEKPCPKYCDTLGYYSGFRTSHHECMIQKDQCVPNPQNSAPPCALFDVTQAKAAEYAYQSTFSGTETNYQLSSVPLNQTDLDGIMKSFTLNEFPPIGSGLEPGSPHLPPVQYPSNTSVLDALRAMAYPEIEDDVAEQPSNVSFSDRLSAISHGFKTFLSGEPASLVSSDGSAITPHYSSIPDPTAPGNTFSAGDSTNSPAGSSGFLAYVASYIPDRTGLGFLDYGLGIRTDESVAFAIERYKAGSYVAENFLRKHSIPLPKLSK